MLPALLLGIAVGPLGCGVNYLDPCQRLAYRICGCELTQSQQRACESDRIQQQQDNVAPTNEEAAVCVEALNTCTCDALDQNRTDLCGFSRDETEVPVVVPGTSVDGEPT